MTLFEWLSIFAYFSQLGAIVWGIRTMGRSAELRDQAHERRHEETMLVLRQQGEALTHMGAGIERTGQGIERLLERPT